MMKNLFISILLIGLIVPMNNFAQSKVTVRGKLVEQGSKDKIPLSSVAVTILNTTDSARTIPVYTGSDGMYLIYDVIPREYILEIWNNGFKLDPIKYRIEVVYNDKGFFDIAQIEVQYIKPQKSKK
jgi:hypothetical protein